VRFFAGRIIVKKIGMKKNKDEKEQSSTDPIVLPDECGDSLWDAVLQQDSRNCPDKNSNKNAASLQHELALKQGEAPGNKFTPD
jgi:hypothetical protein